jgi:hypothetical protein
MNKLIEKRLTNKLMDQAYQFLKDHPDINEIELEKDLGHRMRVHLVRFSPSPITYTGWWTGISNPVGYP